MRDLKVILSIDGGGIRGILSLIVLDHINKLLIENGIGSSINKKASLLAGTSTGAVISAALMLEKDNSPLYLPNDILELYKSRGSQIFDKKREDNKYPLQLILENNFGHLKLGDLVKNFVFVSHDQNSNKPFIFNNRKAEFKGVRLSKILLACSAVPEYFPPVELGCYKLSDGIETAKNSSLLAYKNAKQVLPENCYLLISIGTGELPKSMFDSVEEAALKVEKDLEKIEKEANDLIYFRFQPKINKANYKMDDTSAENIANLIEDGNAYIKENSKKFEELIKQWKKFR